MFRTRIIMYGAETCPDCVSAKAKLAAKSDTVELDYRDITQNLKSLKEFLSYRDHDAMFTPIIETGRIGIPFFILGDQTRTFDIDGFLGIAEPTQTGGSCSVDGKNC